MDQIISIQFKWTAEANVDACGYRVVAAIFWNWITRPQKCSAAAAPGPEKLKSAAAQILSQTNIADDDQPLGVNINYSLGIFGSFGIRTSFRPHSAAE